MRRRLCRRLQLRLGGSETGDTSGPQRAFIITGLARQGGAARARALLNVEATLRLFVSDSRRVFAWAAKKSFKVLFWVVLLAFI